MSLSINKTAHETKAATDRFDPLARRSRNPSERRVGLALPFPFNDRIGNRRASPTLRFLTIRAAQREIRR
jgi:hypothetical protein